MKTSGLQAKRANTLKSDKLAPEIRCLVSGFEPFNNSYHNPSADIAKNLPSSLHPEKAVTTVAVKSILLPVIGDEAWAKLKPEIDALPRHKQSIIIMLGLADKRKVLGMERFALNIRDYRIKDNSGKQILAEDIETGAPQAVRTQAPLLEALGHLSKKGAPIEISNHAGTFICNETYFRALRYVDKLKLPVMVYFVHVPLPRIYGKALAEAKFARWCKLSTGKENQLRAMGQVVEMLIKYSAGEINKNDSLSSQH